MASNDASPTETPRAWWRRLLTIPGLVGATALTTAVSWGATAVITRVAESSAPEDAIAISVETDPARIAGVNTAGRTMVIPAGRRTTGSPGPYCDGFHRWGVRNSGIDSEESIIQVVAQGRSDKAVLLRGLSVRVLSKQKPAPGIQVLCPNAGDASFRALSIDLDASPPTVEYDSKSGDPFGFTLANGETETFLVTARATTATYVWRLELDVVVDGVKKTIGVGPSRGYTTTVARPGAVWHWNWENAWSLDPDHSKLVQAGDPLPQP
jgi:hypothetical protein